MLNDLCKTHTLDELFLKLTCKGWVRQSQGPCFGWRTSGDLTSAIVGKWPEWNPCSLPLGSELTCKLLLPAMPDPLELLVQLLFSLKLFPPPLAVARWANPSGRLNGLVCCCCCRATKIKVTYRLIEWKLKHYDWKWYLFFEIWKCLYHIWELIKTLNNWSSKTIFLVNQDWTYMLRNKKWSGVNFPNMLTCSFSSQRSQKHKKWVK